MDVISLVKSKTHYRLLYDFKGIFGLAKIASSGAEFKLLKLREELWVPKMSPYIVTNNGRTLRFLHLLKNFSDTIKGNLRTNEIVTYFKFEIGCKVMITGGNKIGRVDILERVEKREGSYDIVHIKMRMV
jgi:small subunit ribosomal protein S4e